MKWTLFLLSLTLSISPFKSWGADPEALLREAHRLAQSTHPSTYGTTAVVTLNIFSAASQLPPELAGSSFEELFKRVQQAVQTKIFGYDGDAILISSTLLALVKNKRVDILSSPEKLKELVLQAHKLAGTLAGSDRELDGLLGASYSNLGFFASNIVYALASTAGSTKTPDELAKALSASVRLAYGNFNLNRYTPRSLLGTMIFRGLFETNTGVPQVVNEGQTPLPGPLASARQLARDLASQSAAHSYDALGLTEGYFFLAVLASPNPEKESLLSRYKKVQDSSMAFARTYESGAVIPAYIFLALDDAQRAAHATINVSAFLKTLIRPPLNSDAVAFAGGMVGLVNLRGLSTEPCGGGLPQAEPLIEAKSSN